MQTRKRIWVSAAVVGMAMMLATCGGKKEDEGGDLRRQALPEVPLFFRISHVLLPSAASCESAGYGSILYPSPQTTFRYRGLEGSISSFSRRWRIWTATAPSEPKAVSFHTCS